MALKGISSDSENVYGDCREVSEYSIIEGLGNFVGQMFTNQLTSREYFANNTLFKLLNQTCQKKTYLLSQANNIIAFCQVVKQFKDNDYVIRLKLNIILFQLHKVCTKNQRVFLFITVQNVAPKHIYKTAQEVENPKYYHNVISVTHDNCKGGDIEALLNTNLVSQR